MTSKRRYDDSCGLAQGLNVVGDRWALHVVRELLLEPRRFADLRADLPGISSNVLTQRLTDLEEAGVVRRRRLPPPAASWVYELTGWGAELEPVILQLGAWAARSSDFDTESPLSCTSVVLSMRTMFRLEAAEGVVLRIGFRLAERNVLARIETEQLDVVVVESLAAAAAAVVTTTPEVLAKLLFDRLDLDAALGEGLVSLEGDRAGFERYLACFRLSGAAS
ncbi:winged helix-turn-helix transcriptional regulator [Kribbella turkmenica]|nr:helix-turn-helix domain-containing protein [Kribbella turkmenica]